MSESGKTIQLKTIPQGTAGDTGKTSVEGFKRYHVQANFSDLVGGSGKIKLQISVDGESFSDYPNSELSYPPSSGDNHQWIVTDGAHAFFRVATTNVIAGAGDISIKAFMKRFQ